jgi:hypothetical protein
LVSFCILLYDSLGKHQTEKSPISYLSFPSNGKLLRYS